MEFEQKQHSICLPLVSVHMLLPQLPKMKKDSRDAVNREFVLPDALEKLFNTGSSQQSYYPLNARKVSWGYLLHKYWLHKFLGGSLALELFLLKQ